MDAVLFLDVFFGGAVAGLLSTAAAAAAATSITPTSDITAPTEQEQEDEDANTFQEHSVTQTARLAFSVGRRAEPPSLVALCPCKGFFLSVCLSIGPSASIERASERASGWTNARSDGRVSEDHVQK